MYVTLNAKIALIQGIMLAFSFICQFVSSFALGQSLLLSATGLIGMKPLAEAIRGVFGAKQSKRQKLSNEYMLFISRTCEMCTETIPQSLVQIIGLLQTAVEDRSKLQYVSIGMSIVSASFAITMSDRVLDSNHSNKLSDPLLYGYVQLEEGMYAQLVAMLAFFMSYGASKMFALSILIQSSSNAIIVPLVLCFEFLLLLGVRMSLGN